MLKTVVLLSGASLILYGIAAWDLIVMAIGIVVVVGMLILGRY